MAFDDMPVPDFADVVVESLSASTHAIPADPEC